MPDQIHQIGRVLAVVNRKDRIEADLLSVFAKKPCADPVKCPGPGERIRHNGRVRSEHLRTYPIAATRHLARGTAREGHQKNAAWVRAIHDEVRDTMGER